MHKLSVREVRAALPQLERVLEEQGELVITKRGRPIARVLPIPAGSMPSHADFRAAMPRLRDRRAHCRKSVSAFQSDIAQGYLEVCPLADHHALRAVALLGQLHDHPLRTLDALHLAVAQTIRSQTVATADRVMARAAEALGFKAVAFR